MSNPSRPNSEIKDILGDSSNINWPTAFAYVGCSWAGAWALVNFVKIILG